ncbi:MAG: isoprenylcysteine carboxylmethyltransferase family protein [Anaerolineales bacterium]
MFWLILSVLLWGVFHSLMASLKAKDLARRWFGARVVRYYRLVYNLFAAFSFILIMGVATLTPNKTLYYVPLPWSGLMAFGEALAVAGLVIGFLQTDIWEFLGLRQLRESDKPPQLITSGVYRYVRHPLYAAGLVFIWLLPHMTFNVLVINISLTIYILIGASFEERKLLLEFGKEYSDYAAVTPMLIPFAKKKKSL